MLIKFTLVMLSSRGVVGRMARVLGHNTSLLIFLFFYHLYFLLQDEGTLRLTKPSREFLTKHFASREVTQLEYRSTWALVCIKGGGAAFTSQWIGETLNKSPSLSKWAKPVTLRTSVSLLAEAKKCVWGVGVEARRRTAFCDKYDGYDKICHCKYFFMFIFFLLKS